MGQYVGFGSLIAPLVALKVFVCLFWQQIATTATVGCVGRRSGGATWLGLVWFGLVWSDQQQVATETTETTKQAAIKCGRCNKLAETNRVYLVATTMINYNCNSNASLLFCCASTKAERRRQQQQQQPPTDGYLAPTKLVSILCCRPVCVISSTWLAASPAPAELIIILVVVVVVVVNVINLFDSIEPPNDNDDDDGDDNNHRAGQTNKVQRFAQSMAGSLAGESDEPRHEPLDFLSEIDRILDQ